MGLRGERRIHARLSEFDVVGDDEAIVRFATAALDGMILQQIAYGDPTQTERSIKLLQRVLAALRDGGEHGRPPTPAVRSS